MDGERIIPMDKPMLWDMFMRVWELIGSTNNYHDTFGPINPEKVYHLFRDKLTHVSVVLDTSTGTIEPVDYGDAVWTLSPN
jgi:hypothetical protein